MTLGIGFGICIPEFFCPCWHLLLGMSVGMPVNVTQCKCGEFAKCSMNNQMCVSTLHVNKINKSKQFIVFWFHENMSVLQNDINSWCFCSLSKVVTRKKTG